MKPLKRNGPKRIARKAAAGRPSRWSALSKLAEKLEVPPDELQLETALAAIGRLLKARGLAVTVTDGAETRVLARWGWVPRTWQVNRAPPGWRSWPLRVKRVEYGRLWVKGGAWEDDPVAPGLIRATTRLLATALQGQAVLWRERDQRALAETLQHVAQALASTLDVEEVLARILDEIARLVPYDSATVMLLEDGVLHLHAERGFDRPAVADKLTQVAFIPEQTPLVMEVLSGHQPVIVPDVTKVPGWIWVPGSAHIRSWMGVPLRVHDRATGMFSIDKAQPGSFTRRHAALAAAVAPQAAIAIENARLFRDLKAAEGQLRGLSARVIEVQEAERQRIGRELHDHAGQALLALRAELQILARQLPPQAESAEAQLAKVDEIVRETGRDLRLLAHDLRSHLLEELGLSSALQQHVRDFTDRFGVKTELVAHDDALRRRPRAVELAAFRIAQEALTNVARHAGARTVRVSLVELPGRLQLTVEDDGCGFDPEACGAQGCYGIIGMRERAAAVDGTLQLWSRPGHGTRLIAEFPDELKVGRW
jgi:signal transduction histidine kinase